MLKQKLINLLINLLNFLVSTGCINGMVAFHMILSHGSHYKTLNKDYYMISQ